MPEKVFPGQMQKEPCIKEAVCIHTKKVYDSCKDKDCVENLRVYPTRRSQCILDRAINVKARTAELLWVYLDVEAVPFNRGFYTVDVKFFYRITCDAFCGVGRPQEIHGLATYDKRVILFGSEGAARIFSSKMALESADRQLMATSNMPTAVCEVVDPIVLDVKLTDPCHCFKQCDAVLSEVPDSISRFFEDDVVLDDGEKRLYVTLGQFSIIKIERDSQLLIPVYDFCMPEKECIGNETDPCEMFNRIKFPVDEFFPPANTEEGGEGGWRGCCK